MCIRDRAYTGRIAVGRVHRGTLKEVMNITLAKRDGDVYKRQTIFNSR